MNRILIISHGAIATFIGAALQQNSENEITHYVRPGGKNRLQMELQFNDRRSRAFKIAKGSIYQYRTINHLEGLSTFDYIIAPVAFYQLKPLVVSLLPYLQSRQVLVIAGNVWDDFEWLQSVLPCPFIFVFPNFGGAVVQDKLTGWLTTSFTLGTTQPAYLPKVQVFQSLLESAGFKPRQMSDIRGWLLTHFACNAGMLTAAARQNGFTVLAKKWHELQKMYLLIRECVQVVGHTGVDTGSFPEGRKAFQSLWIQTLTTYLLFLLPGVAASADAGKNLPDWLRYGQAIQQKARHLGLETPLLDVVLGV